ncbi:acyltransferase family protein [Noviherbaspirillum sp. ST9]|uniref:acyltransferase family protein n=1 Tax=Noviherbaspirillum sp. ST9 TaxID=3401606 RepID=UPI003B5872BD
MNGIQKSISTRIEILRYVMIFGIVILHTPPYVPLSDIGDSFFDFIKAFFQHAVFRTAVPVLTFVSGYLLFRTPALCQFAAVASKKTRTLLVPLILFNLPIALVVLYLQFAYDGVSLSTVELYPFNLLEFIDACVGLVEAPINYPLAFLRDLFVISLLAPVWHALYRHVPRLGAVLVFVVFWFNLDFKLVLRNEMAILFYFGGLASFQQWDMTRLDKHAAKLLLLFAILCAGVVAFRMENRVYLGLISPLMIWPAASLLLDTTLGKWIAGMAKYSFLTFLMQGPILTILWMGYNELPDSVPYWIFWLVAPVSTAYIVALAYRFGVANFPGLMGIALGRSPRTHGEVVQRSKSGTAKY